MKNLILSKLRKLHSLIERQKEFASPSTSITRLDLGVWLDAIEDIMESVRQTGTKEEE